MATIDLRDRADMRASDEAARAIEAALAREARFVANTTHELRTPLATLLGATATLLRPEVPLDENGRLLASLANAGARRLARLIEDLLLTSGLAEGAQCRRGRIDVAERIRAAEAGDTRRERLRVRLHGDLSALGDHDGALVVLTHLIDNALKFSPPGSAVRVAAARVGSQIRVTVADDGAPIAPDLRERIFERFFQVDASETRRHGGVGLGLYLARQLARAMGGDVRLLPSRTGNVFALTLCAFPHGPQAAPETSRPTRLASA